MPSNRRSLLTHSARAALAAPFFIREMISKSPSSTVRVASFGADGMAYFTLDGIGRHPKVTLACVAEVDSSRLAKGKAKNPNSRVCQDWRTMLAKEKGKLEVPCLATPDHIATPTPISANRE